MRKHIYPYLDELVDESIAILRDAAAEAENPVMLYSIGKDSTVMLHLAIKAFYPMKLPFPVMHIDTTWKFQDMICFRDRMKKKYDFNLIVHTHHQGLADSITPFSHGSARYTDIMKTEALKEALNAHGFDLSFGGARRDEEKSRAKERIFSFRNSTHFWDPRNQRPELWEIRNTVRNKGESLRVFPLSNWTEIDVWRYVYRENLEVVPLYFAAPRPVVRRDGQWIMVDDHRFPLQEGEYPEQRMVRFRTLGCYPLTAAIESEADCIEAILQEMESSRQSERAGRLIDFDQTGSMERKKAEGYF